MNASFERATLTSIYILFTLLFSPILMAANVSVYLSPPRVQETSNVDSVVESFNSLRSGPMAAEVPLSIGTLENPMATAKVVDGSLTGGARLSKYVMGSPFKIKFDTRPAIWVSGGPPWTPIIKSSCMIFPIT